MNFNLTTTDLKWQALLGGFIVSPLLLRRHGCFLSITASTSTCTLSLSTAMIYLR
ncbi:unnamed protein product [Thlaspi arvense]|uniref:Uncharacterized protein n=1 Tax=Thlaspi arvense TaxID=13288 RepID=A0AAU9S936_THLAR|nr:unnamed protein product [Thlaspi arvense]